MEETFSNLETYGYIGLFLYSIGGGFVAIVVAGVLSYMGKMDITASITIAFIANALGGMMLFYLARYQKAMMMDGLKKHRRKLALAHLLLKRNGSWIIVAQKFVYGVKTIIPIALGLTKYSFKKFAFYNAIGAALWALVFGVGSFIGGSLLVKATEYVTTNPWIAPLMLFTFCGSLWLYLSKATKKKKRN